MTIAREQCRKFKISIGSAPTCVYMLFLTDIFMHVACILKFINHPDVSFYFPAAKVLHGKIGAIGFEQV